MSAEGFAGFVEDEREDGEGCDRVGPFDFEKRVGGEAGGKSYEVSPDQPTIDLPVGVYPVTISAPGYQVQSIPSVPMQNILIVDGRCSLRWFMSRPIESGDAKGAGRSLGEMLGLGVLEVNEVQRARDRGSKRVPQASL